MTLQEIHAIKRLAAVRVLAQKCILLSVVLFMSPVACQYKYDNGTGNAKLTSNVLLLYTTVVGQLSFLIANPITGACGT